MPVIPKKHLLGPPPPSDEELSGKINAVLMAAKARKDTIARPQVGRRDQGNDDQGGVQPPGVDGARPGTGCWVRHHGVARRAAVTGAMDADRGMKMGMTTNLRSTLLVLLILAFACGDDSGEPAFAPQSQGLGDPCELDLGYESDDCKAGLHCGSNSECGWGMCYPSGCKTASDCPSIDGKDPRCDDGVCGWNCYSDWDCPQTLTTPLECVLSPNVTGEPGDCLVADEVCNQ